MDSPRTPGTPDEGFGLDELFFSTTDAGGRIRTGNAVFTRVCGYSAQELAGRAHNVVRHPDMPRLVFRVLWEHLAAGQPVAAYVKNRTKDGRPYWVVATASPLGDGHLSVRFKPSGELFPVVRDVYEVLRATEVEAEAAGGSRNDAIEASAAHLDGILAGLGLPDYDAFMRVFLPAELRSRERGLEGSPYWDRLWTGHPPVSAGRAGMLDVLEAFRGVDARMRNLFSRLADQEALSAALAARSRDLTGDTRLLSLNALLGARRHGEDGAALSVVAGLIGTEAERTAAVTAELNRHADILAGLLGDQTFRVTVGRLQAEMAVFFALEALAGGDDCHAELAVLDDALARSADAIGGVASALGDGLASVTEQVEAVGGLLRTLDVLQLNGTIEASRIDGADGVRQLFGEMRHRLDAAREEIDGLAAIARTARRHAGDGDRAATVAAVSAASRRVALLAA
ncbi:MAG: PAS domain-containing protein [Thermoleophilia bacterium]|nr:PAS domain-containing protein [Thermoleophilia bacterium]